MKYAICISMTIMTYLLATDIYTPSMPEIQRYFNVSSNEVQKTMSYFLMGAVITCIVAGIFADQFGKKRFFLGGMAVAVIGSLMTIFCPSINWLIYGRFLQGLGGGVASVIGFATIFDLYKEEQAAKIFGWIGVNTAVLPSFAPFIGGMISTYFGWHVIFVVIMVLFLLCFLSIWYCLPESLDTKSGHSDMGILKSYKEIVTNRMFLSLALLSPLYNSVEWFYLTYLPFYMQKNIGVTPELYGFIVGAIMISFAAGSYGGSKLIAVIGVHKTIMTSLYFGGFSALFLWLVHFALPTSVLAISTGLSIFLIAFGMLFPSSVSSALNLFKDAKIRASSIRSLFITIFAFIGSISAEWVDDTTLSSLAIYISICCILAFAVYNMKGRKNKLNE